MIYRTEIKFCRVGAIFKLMKSPKAPESTSWPPPPVVVVVLILVADVCWESFRSWILMEEEFDDWRCEGSGSLLTIRWSDAAMSKEAWKRWRLWRKIFVGLKRGSAKRENGLYEITETTKIDITDRFVSHRKLVQMRFLPTLLKTYIILRKGFLKKGEKLTIGTDCHTSSRFDLTVYKDQPVILHRVTNVIADTG